MIYPSRRNHIFVAIKVLHTTIWCFFVGCILAIPVTGYEGRFGVSVVLTGLVLVECAVLGANDGRCPLTGLAGRFTHDRADNFDIYLPLWLARRNKAIFGTLFAAGELFVIGRWLFIHF